jgi:hypothetical protein
MVAISARAGREPMRRALAPPVAIAKFRMSRRNRPFGSEQEQSMAIDGKWNIVMKTPTGDQQAELTLKQEGGALTGQMSGAAGVTSVEEGKVDGDKLTWSAKITSPMPVKLEFEGKLEGGSISGKVKLGAFGTSTFSGAPA